jgi:hypothetical protein
MIAAVVAASANLLMTLLVAFGGVRFGSWSAWNVADVLAMLAIAYAFHRASRVGAILGSLYLLYSKVQLFIEFRRVGAVLGLLIFGYFFVRGTIAAFRLRRVVTGQPSPTIPDATSRPTSHSGASRGGSASGRALDN